MAPLNRNPPLGVGALPDVARAVLPADYVEFLTTQADGGEGFIGDAYVILWRASELPQLNAAYEVELNAPGLLLFGSNGGGDAFAFDLRGNARSVVQVPFVGMELENVERLADTFTDFLAQLASDRPDGAPMPKPSPNGNEGREIWEIQPVLFGGSPTDPQNKTIVTRQQHIELVRYWSGVLREVRKNFTG